MLNESPANFWVNTLFKFLRLEVKVDGALPLLLLPLPFTLPLEEGGVPSFNEAMIQNKKVVLKDLYVDLKEALII